MREQNWVDANPEIYDEDEVDFLKEDKLRSEAEESLIETEE